MDIWEMAELEARKDLGERYLEFFIAEAGTLSLGLYVLQAGDTIRSSRILRTRFTMW